MKSHTIWVSIKREFFGVAFRSALLVGSFIFMIFYYSVYFYLFYVIIYYEIAVNFVKSYLFVPRQNKDSKILFLHTHITMVPSSLVQHLYEYSVLSSFEVTSTESFLSTVNNGKALSMTILYPYMYCLF